MASRKTSLWAGIPCAIELTITDGRLCIQPRRACTGMFTDVLDRERGNSKTKWRAQLLTHLARAYQKIRVLRARSLVPPVMVTSIC